MNKHFTPNNNILLKFISKDNDTVITLCCYPHTDKYLVEERRKNRAVNIKVTDVSFNQYIERMLKTGYRIRSQ